MPIDQDAAHWCRHRGAHLKYLDPAWREIRTLSTTHRPTAGLLPGTGRGIAAAGTLSPLAPLTFWCIGPWRSCTGR